MKQNTAISKHLQNPRCILVQAVELLSDVWINDGHVIFQYKHGALPS